MTGEKGNYEIRLLVNSSLDEAWKAITNYTSVNNFIPDVVSSKVVESNGNRKILDQIYQSTYTLGIKVKVRVQIQESYPKGIRIDLIRGDFLNKFQGNLSLKPTNTKQLLVVYTVKVDPKIPFSKDLFFDIYQERLLEGMRSLKKTLESRPS